MKNFIYKPIFLTLFGYNNLRRRVIGLIGRTCSEIIISGALASGGGWAGGRGGGGVQGVGGGKGGVRERRKGGVQGGGRLRKSGYKGSK
jgi:hypothetical protein